MRTSAEGRTDLPSRPWPYFLSTSQEPTTPRRPCSNPTSCRHRCANLCIVVTADGFESDINILVSIAYTVPLLAFKLRLARLGTRSRAVFETRRTRRQDCLENSFSGERLFNKRPGLNRVRGVLFCAGFCRPENAAELRSARQPRAAVPTRFIWQPHPGLRAKSRCLSCEAAKECSPERKPMVKAESRSRSPEGRKRLKAGEPARGPEAESQALPDAPAGGSQRKPPPSR